MRAAVAQLDDLLGTLVDLLRYAAKQWLGNSTTEATARRAIADRLRRLSPHTAAAVRPLLAGGARIVVDGRRVTVNPLDDPLIQETLKNVDAKVRIKARLAAADLATGRAPLRTDRQIRDFTERIMNVGSPAEAASVVIATRTAALAAIEAAGDTLLAWRTHPNRCKRCAAYAGSVARPGDIFRPRYHLASQFPWAVNGIDMPPLHDHCRCFLEPAHPALVRRMIKEATRNTAEGKASHLSAPAKARATRRLLRTRTPLTPASARKAATLARTIA